MKKTLTNDEQEAEIRLRSAGLFGKDKTSQFVAQLLNLFEVFAITKRWASVK